MFNTKIKLKKDLTERIKRCAKAGGYSSAEEFIEQILTRELVTLEDAGSDKETVKKLRLKKDTTERIKRCAEAEGYSSAQEFVEHILTRELVKLEDAESDEEIVRKLKGLGYLE